MAYDKPTREVGVNGDLELPSERASDPPIPISFVYKKGDVIAERYRLKRVLGKGGVGMVWHAHDETLDIDVALKLVRGEMLLEETADRLHREARAAAKIDHPGIVRILDFGNSDIGEPFIVMELLEGEDLRTRLERHGRLQPVDAVRVVLPVAHALDVAHGRGIVHRDVKPENIFLAKVGPNARQPKLLDFGIAKLEHLSDVRLTRTGALLGSPSYMAPEQARGDDADHRADIWSLCVVLYEMIALRPPFGGDNKNAILHAIITKEAQPLPELASGVEDLWPILRAGFAKDPDKRWQTTAELIDILCSWLLSRGVSEDITGSPIAPARKQDALRDPLSSFPPPPPSPRVSQETTTLSISESPSHRRRNRLVAFGGLALVSLAVSFAVLRNRGLASPGEAVSPAPAITAPLADRTKQAGETTRGGSLDVPPPASSTAASARTPQPTEAPTAATTAVAAEKASAHVPKQRPRATTTTKAPPRKLRDPFQ